MRTRIALIAGFVLSTLLVATVAVAAEGDVALDGRGALVAAGVGHVELAGQGHVGLKMSGDVTIIDYAGDADVQIRSASDAAASDAGPESTTISLTGFTGVVTVSGSDFAVEATGRFRRIAAKGSGTAFLQGWGWYRTASGHRGLWTPNGVRVNIQPAG